MTKFVPHYNGREVTQSQWNLMYCTSGTLLKAACKGEGLSVKGVNHELGARLTAAGLTHQQVIDSYGWKRRQ